MTGAAHRIETPRLLLREFEVEDWPAVLAFSGPEAMRFFDDWSTKRGRRVSTYYYAILREEWEG